MRSSEAYRVPKIVMDSKERDYQEAKKAALSQGRGNPYIAGIQSSDEAVKASRTEYGAPTVMPQNAGPEDKGFEQKDSPANVVPSSPTTTTGNVGMSTSTTADPAAADGLEDDRLNRRLNAYTKAMGNSDLNLNNLSQTTRLS
mgnify:CR=1 FL=1